MVWDKPPPDDEITEFDRNIIGHAKRLTIPLIDDRAANRAFADLLRGLAQIIDFEACREGPVRERLFRVGHEINSTNSKIRSVAREAGIMVREGRPKAAESGAQSQNRGGTAVTVSPFKPPHLVDRRE